MEVIRIEKRCNHNCLFCGADPVNEGDYTNEFNRLTEMFKSAKPDEIIEISGGEPTLSPMLPKLLLMAKHMNRRINLQTNAMRFADDRFTKLMVKAGLQYAFVSLHAPDAKISNALTRCPGAFDLTVKGIESLLENGVNVSLNCVVCRLNAERLTDYVQFVAKRFRSDLTVVLSYVNPFYHAWEHKKLIPRISDVMPHMKAALIEGEKLGLDMHVPDICGIPLCFLKDVERFADKYKAVVEGWPFHPHSDKIKLEVCDKCVWSDVCDGMWKRYLELHGSDEVVAVKTK